MIRSLRIIVWSLDFGLAAIGATISYFLLPSCVGNEFSSDLLGVGISVLSIVFSIFFASLTFVISSSNDNFVNFLKKKEIFDEIIWMYRWTLGSLFILLVYSLVLYTFSSYLNSINGSGINSVYLVAFTFLFLYSLSASALSTESAIKYAERRATFIRIENKSSGESKGDSIESHSSKDGNIPNS